MLRNDSILEHQPLYLRCVSVPLAIVYGSVMYLRRLFYRFGIFKQHRLPGKTISVGNLRLGGSGKTPMVLAITKQLQSMGKRCAVLTRGYGSGLPKGAIILLRNGDIWKANANLETRFFADEPFLLSNSLSDTPIVVGADRVAGANYLLQFDKPDIWILDDGFQHLRVARDIDLLMYDGISGLPIPAGPFREFSCVALSASILALPSSLAKNSLPETKQARCFYQTVFDQPKLISANKHKAPVLQSAQQCIAVCAIARPQRFITALESLGFTVTTSFCFNDHQVIDAHQLNQATKGREDLAIVTTWKDYYRHPDVWRELNNPVWVLPNRIEIADSGFLDILA